MLKKALFVLLALLLLLAAAMAVGTLRHGSRQLNVAAAPVLVVDKDAAAASLAMAVRSRTVSGLLDPEGQAQAFDTLHAHLRERYPLVHSRLALEVVHGRTLVFTWPGSDPQAKPIALMAHQDVVPVAPGTESLWQHKPFDGDIADGFVWGRGTWDDKGNLIAQLEAVEKLLASDFRPRRTVFLIFGHDEEVGGAQGAQAVAELFRQRALKLDFVLDEGMLIVHDMLPGLRVPAALIGIAEKGSASVLLDVQATGGHSSMPPVGGNSAIGIVSTALTKIDARPMPGAVQGVAGQMFDVLAPEMGLVNRVVLSNRWLFGPVITRLLAGQPATNAMLRSTTALTVVHAGNKENVVPGHAEATVNFRLLPGDTGQTVLDHVQQVAGDPRITLKLGPGAFAASPVSATDGAGYRHIERTLRELSPGTVVAPSLMLGATDARHFVGVADQIYRFSPIAAGPDDLPRFHGTNERLSVDQLAEMIRFYHRLLQQAAQ